ncbi:MAG: hypothetical protein EZS28_050552, partial [Streblomastix strix]
KLTISKLEVKDITIASYSIIKVNSGSGIVDISESKFNNISRTGANGKGSVLQVEFNSYIGKLIMSRTLFIDCKVETDSGLGGAIYLKIQSGEIELSKVTMNQCSAKNGGAIYSSLIEGSSMIIKDSSSFSECKSIDGNGGSLYVEIQSGEIELSEVTMNQCSAKNGGAIYSSLIEGSSMIIKDSSSFSECKSIDGNGGSLYVEIQSGEIELSEVTMNQCSAKNGGAIYSSLIEGSSMIIKDSSSFSECKSITGNGGAMYIDIDLTSQSKFELIDTTFQSCQSKNSTPPSSSTSPFGYGGAIFLTAKGQYDPLKNGKALKGALFDSNSALNGGQN